MKIKNIVILLILLIAVSCVREDKEYRENKHNLLFIYSPYIQVDYNKRKIYVNYPNLEESRILFSVKEEMKIKKSFEKNDIASISGKVYLRNDTSTVSPPDEFRIKLYVKAHEQSEMIIDDNFSTTEKLTDENHRISSFRDEIISVLESNNDFKKAHRKLLNDMTKTGAFIL